MKLWQWLTLIGMGLSIECATSIKAGKDNELTKSENPDILTYASEEIEHKDNKFYENLDNLESSILNLLMFEGSVNRDSTFTNNLKNWGDSTDVDFMIRGGFINYLQKDFDESIKKYSTAESIAKLSKKDVKILLDVLKARSYEAKGDYKKAIASYNEAIKENKKDDKAIFGVIGNECAIWNPLYFLGKLYEKQGKNEKALEYYLNAIDSSQNALNRYTSGEATLLRVISEFYYFKMKDREKALEYLRKAEDTEKTGPQIKIK